MTWLFLVVAVVGVILVLYLLSKKEELEADRKIREVRDLERLQDAIRQNEMSDDLMPTILRVEEEYLVQLRPLEERFKKSVLTDDEIRKLTELRVALKRLEMLRSKNSS